MRMLGQEVAKLLALLLAGALGVAARNVTDVEFSRIPKLYHLDDFESCLMQSDGLYCLGTFHVKPLHDPDPVYDLMKEYSSYPYHFNRTLIHRGYCVTSRCPSVSDRNVSLRFERCTAAQAQRHNLRVLLTELNYCRTHAQHVTVQDVSNSVETPHRVFLYVVGFILALNIIGTVYDVKTTSFKKNRLLTSWSVAVNWPQLAGPYPDDDPRTYTRMPFEAFRTIMILLVVVVHVACLQTIVFIQNPKFIEEMLHLTLGILVQNGSACVQMFVVLANFLLADSLLRMEQTPSFGVLPKLVLKRIFRIAPVYVLVTSFAATWWPLTRDGPMWPMVVGQESEVCKRKFWVNMLFLQNFVEPNQSCLWQTWFIAVDMQLYVVGCVIMLCLLRMRRSAMPLLALGFVLAIIINSYRAYVNDWKALMFINTPDNLRTKFRDAASFSHFYTSPMGSLPACLMGLFTAHLLHHMKDVGFALEHHKWLMVFCHLMLPAVPLWLYSGYYFRQFDSPAMMALFIALERPVLTIFAALLIFGTNNGTAMKETLATETDMSKDTKVTGPPKKRFLQRVFGGRVWYPLGRMSLGVLMLHWCVNCILVGSKLSPRTSSILDVVSDWISTSFLTYLLAVPVTLLVEMPFLTLYSALVS